MKRSRIRHYFGLLSSAFLLISSFGCSSAEINETGAEREESKKAPALTTEKRGPRFSGEIAPGFEIRISALEDRNLNGKFRVGFDGKLKLPYDVTISTRGQTVDSLKERLIDAYQGYFKSRPSISVSISEEKYWVDVRGLVDKPGRQLISESTSLDEVISLAGGLQKTATVRYVKIQQAVSTATIKLADYYSGASQHEIPKWEGGDIIFLQSDHEHTEGDTKDGLYIQLLGEVKSPGEYRFTKGMDFYYYLSRAGGPTDRANLGKIEIIRGSPGDDRTSTIFTLDEPSSLAPIQSGDLILVHADKQTSLERNVGLAAGIAGVLNTLILLIFL